MSPAAYAVYLIFFAKGSVVITLSEKSLFFLLGWKDVDYLAFDVNPLAYGVDPIIVKDILDLAEELKPAALTFVVVFCL